MDDDTWRRLYRVLAGLGLPQPVVPVRIPTKPGKPDAELPVGWPDIKVGIAFPHSPAEVFERRDWTVVRLTTPVVKALTDALPFIDEVSFAHLLRASEAAANQSTSKTERKMLDAILRAGLPEPDRNFEVVNDEGRIITVPDFTWHDQKLVVMVDGHFWHGYQEIHDLAAQMNSPERNRVTKDRFKSKAASDADARRWMTAHGWTVIVVSDKTIDDGPAAIAAAADEIAQAYWRLDDAVR